MAAEKLVVVSLIVLQKVTNFEKNLPTYLNLYAQVGGNKFLP